jgi:hypothetical protein
MVSVEFFSGIILPVALRPWGRLSFWQKWVPGVFPGGKGGRCVSLTTLPPFCVVVMKSGNINFLEPSGPLQACNGTAVPLPKDLRRVIYWLAELTQPADWLRFKLGTSPTQLQNTFGTPIFSWVDTQVLFGTIQKIHWRHIASSQILRDVKWIQRYGRTDQRQQSLSYLPMTQIDTFVQWCYLSITKTTSLLGRIYSNLANATTFIMQRSDTTWLLACSSVILPLINGKRTFRS